MYEKREVTYLADTGQRYTLVSHDHETCNKQHCFSMLQLRGPCLGIYGVFIESAPGKLCIYACLYILNAHGSLPGDVLPALIQMTVTQTSIA